MKEVFVIDALRTPVGKFLGTLSSYRPDDLAGFVIQEIMKRNPKIQGVAIEEVILGAANQAGEDNRNVARMAVLLGGLPITVPGVTVNRLCASGLQAIGDAFRAIKNGDGDIYLAGGVESMTRAPFVMSKAESAYDKNIQMFDTSLGWRFTNPRFNDHSYFPYTMGQTAENVANQFNITRDAQDSFALSSQEKYLKAFLDGRFDSEIIPVPIPQKKGEPIIFNKDEHPRLSNLDVLAGLKPAFQSNGTVTAGNSSGLNDGAAILILASGEAVKKYGLNPIAKVISVAAAGVDPSIMGIGPVPATKKALQRAGLTVQDLDLIELNEAFASQSLACINELGLNPEIINVNGGSIAIGHPLGASGARISTTLIHEMQKRTGVKYGLATMCIGVGQGMAIVYEKV